MVNVPANPENSPVSIRAGTEVETVADQASGQNATARAPGGPAELDQVGPRLKAVLRAARYHGVELDPNEFRAASEIPTAADLSEWAQNAGMWSRAVRLRWRHLMRFTNTGPVVLLFTDGTAGLLTGVNTVRNAYDPEDG